MMSFDSSQFPKSSVSEAQLRHAKCLPRHVDNLVNCVLYYFIKVCERFQELTPQVERALQMSALVGSPNNHWQTVIVHSNKLVKQATSCRSELSLIRVFDDFTSWAPRALADAAAVIRICIILFRCG